MILSKLKSSALAILSGLVIVLGFLSKMLLTSRKRLKKERDSAVDAANQAANVLSADNEIEEQTRSRRADALKEINDTGDSATFDNPNRMRDKPKD